MLQRGLTICYIDKLETWPLIYTLLNSCFFECLSGYIWIIINTWPQVHVRLYPSFGHIFDGYYLSYLLDWFGVLGFD